MTGLLTFDEVLAYLGVSRATLRRRIAAGELVAFAEQGRQKLYLAADVLRLHETVRGV